uniref:Uncharacterized protein n=1 Tax=Arundo donax TaxID=35708 RepID=A0A0A9D8W8_ARUDO
MLGMNNLSEMFFLRRLYIHERAKTLELVTNLSLSLTLHDTNSPSHDVAWEQKSNCPQKKQRENSRCVIIIVTVSNGQCMPQEQKSHQLNKHSKDTSLSLNITW